MIALVTHDETWPAKNAERDLVAAIVARLGSPVISVDSGWSGVTARLRTLDATLDAVVVFVRYRDLMRAPPRILSSGGCPVLLIEWDGYFDWWPTSRFHGTFGPTMTRLGIDVMLVSGQRAVEHFVDKGIDARLLAKAFDANRFKPEAGPRAGYVHFGALYPPRRAVLRHLRESDMPVRHVEVPYDELASRLNSYLGGVIVMPDYVIPFGRLGGRVEKVRPGLLIRVGREIEVMQKFFELGACAVAPFQRHTAELGLFGYRDGESVVEWDTYDDLVGVLRHYRAEPDQLAGIGRRAAEIAHERHSWTHRAAELQVIIGNVRDGR